MISFTSQFAQSKPITISPQDVNVDTPVAANDATVQGVLGLVYFIAGVVCVVMIVIGGVRYTLSRGEAQQVEGGRNNILFALIGLLIVIMAAAITQLIFDRL